MLAIFIGFITLSLVSSACDNQCSGHGTCSIDDVCTCYDNWGLGLSRDSGDCSERICPYEIAWIDKPNEIGLFHKYAECAGRGLCNRGTGECQCFDGYEGKACARTSCPNDCSGHGTCEYISDLTYGATWNDYSQNYFHDSSKVFDYHQWDEGKTRGCVCDATYGDVDCSKRMCPYGTDVLNVKDDLLLSTKYQVQEILLIGSGDFPNHLASLFNDPTFGSLPTHGDMYNLNRNNLNGQSFALTFKSKLNETFTTIPIIYNPTDISDFVHDVQLALLKLPNNVIDGVLVQASKVSNSTAGLGPTSFAFNEAIKLNISFTGNFLHLYSINCVNN